MIADISLAIKIAKEMSARYHTKVSHYKCPRCNHFHVGSTLGVVSQKTKEVKLRRKAR